MYIYVCFPTSDTPRGHKPVTETPCSYAARVRPTSETPHVHKLVIDAPCSYATRVRHTHTVNASTIAIARMVGES